MRFHAPYLEWVKKRPSPRFDLAGFLSALLNARGAPTFLSLSWGPTRHDLPSARPSTELRATSEHVEGSLTLAPVATSDSLLGAHLGLCLMAAEGTLIHG